MTRNSATKVADELRNLARELPSTDELVELESALRELGADAPKDEHARRWATIDLFAAFLGDDAEACGSRRERFWPVLDIAVQVLVFVPIAVTWFGLAEAAGAYQAAARAGDLHGESFLEGWETGFGGRLSGLFTFHQLAIDTSALVVLLIIATGVHALRNRLIEEPRHGAVRRRLTSALVQASLELAPLRLGVPERLAEELDIAADKLADTVRAIDATGRIARDSQRRATDALAAVAPTLASVERAAAAAGTAVSALEGAPDRFGSHLGQLTAAAGDITAAQRGMAVSVGDAAAGIAGALHEGAGQVRDTLAYIGVTAAAYTHRAEQAADILGQAHQAIDSLPAAVDGLRADVANVGAQLQNLAAAIAALAELRDVSFDTPPRNAAVQWQREDPAEQAFGAGRHGRGRW